MSRTAIFKDLVNVKDADSFKLYTQRENVKK